MDEVRYMISDASRIVQVEAHVLRYWEEELNLNVGRTELGHRYYTEKNIHEFMNIKELKERGLQLKAIKVLLPELDKKEHKSLEDAYESYAVRGADEDGGRADEQYINTECCMPEKRMRQFRRQRQIQGKNQTDRTRNRRPGAGKNLSRHCRRVMGHRWRSWMPRRKNCGSLNT